MRRGQQNNSSLEHLGPPVALHQPFLSHQTATFSSTTQTSAPGLALQPLPQSSCLAWQVIPSPTHGLQRITSYRRVSWVLCCGGQCALEVAQLLRRVEERLEECRQRRLRRISCSRLRFTGGLPGIHLIKSTRLHKLSLPLCTGQLHQISWFLTAELGLISRTLLVGFKVIALASLCTLEHPLFACTCLSELALTSYHHGNRESAHPKLVQPTARPPVNEWLLPD